MQAAQAVARAICTHGILNTSNFKRVTNVRGTFSGSQPRLCTRDARANEHIVPERNPPPFGERPGDQLCLVEAAFALAHARQRDWNERGALRNDIGRPRQPCQAIRHAARRRMPSMVFERVHDSAADFMRHPARRSCRAHERRQLLAQPAIPSGRWMPAAVTLWARQQREPRPAERADDLALGRGHRSLAGDADAWKQEIERRAKRAGGPRLARRAIKCARGHERTAFHMASRSGIAPNQRSNASAPCSTSIASPSAARSPRARQACTHGVSPRR